ncbi:TIGR04222 domain-containing membrane protein [Kitasatospora aburaviensis]
MGITRLIIVRPVRPAAGPSSRPERSPVPGPRLVWRVPVRWACREREGWWGTVGGRGPRSAGSGATGEGQPGEALSLYELAYLVGGGYRVAETALVRMIRTNRLEMNREGMLRVIRPRPHDDVEAVLLAAIGPSGTAWLGAPRARARRARRPGSWRRGCAAGDCWSAAPVPPAPPAPPARVCGSCCCWGWPSRS